MGAMVRRETLDALARIVKSPIITKNEPTHNRNETPKDTNVTVKKVTRLFDYETNKSSAK